MKTKCFQILAALALMAAPAAQAQTIVPQAFEQTLITPAAEGRYLWLPIEEAAPEGKVQVIVDGRLQIENNVRVARDKVDYYMPLDLQPYQKGGALRVVVQNVPTQSLGFAHIAQNADPDHALLQEYYRPRYHHTPKRGWMNDPNGMFHKDGVWHLYYQHNPYGSMWGNMHWRHSTSSDLVHWNDEGLALEPDVFGTMFSGSAVTDQGRVVAMYTASRPTPFGGDVQTQGIAFSDDNGRTFTKYEGNPVLTSDARDYRDPKMFWHQATQQWVMILAAGQEMCIYNSPDLKRWTYASSFGLGYGNHGGVWECPDLFQLGDKWVLICNINPGGPFGGSAAQYFVGDFDGKTFTCHSKPETTKWMDYGKDHYAAVSFYNAPEQRRVVMAWMSNWQYANQVPTKQFRSANSIPRDLGIFDHAGETYLSVKPSKEMLALRGRKIAKPTDACEILIDLKRDAQITLSNAGGEQVVMTYDAAQQTFSMDRTRSGKVDFSADFPAVTTAPTRGKVRQLRLFIDRCSIETFDADGKMAMTNLVFPITPYDQIKVKGGKATIYQLNP
ncbi:MAG: GH32 C-terminal domain-containing protein [Bacteroidaceae bacterium]|nr:GH32 C-terminal domain-containing protein [Bacteroidaceae bacterium]